VPVTVNQSKEIQHYKTSENSVYYICLYYRHEYSWFCIQSCYSNWPPKKSIYF